MKPEQQRIAIAEACGWRIGHTTKYAWVVICPSNIERAWSSHNGVMNDKPTSYYLPDYINDLNAMHEAEKKLPDVLFVRYANWIPPCATAEARAEAFLRTLGKWEDAE